MHSIIIYTDLYCAGVLHAILLELHNFTVPNRTAVKPILTTVTSCTVWADKEKWAWINPHGVPSRNQFAVTSYCQKFATRHCPKVTRACIVRGNCCTTCNTISFPEWQLSYVLCGWIIRLYTTSWTGTWPVYTVAFFLFFFGETVHEGGHDCVTSSTTIPSHNACTCMWLLGSVRWQISGSN